ncbi:MAG: fluoride efflux transporter CrcB [Sulfurospirillaceae bacterium]|nr:fluoride efflux transporter CrcB [Sulfurospirillaceae bacterium]MDD2825843.1 fluoride efflux transporter CrcB [Sulfurospirillaceae bacterium]
MSWQTLLAIGSGGFIGSILRAYLNGLINRHLPHAIPFGTLGVNILGSFIIGALFAIFMHTTLFSAPMKSFLTTGLLGGLTTYSTFALETFWLFNEGSLILALSNTLLNVIGTILAAGSGFKIINFLLK